MDRSDGKVALVHGAASTLGLAVAVEMARHGVAVALCDETPGAAPRLGEIRDAVTAVGGTAEVVACDGTPQAIVDEVIGRLGRLDFLINLYLPDPAADDVGRVVGYPARLLERCMVVGTAIASAGEGGAILNQACLPSLYADTPLADGMPLLRNGLTGVTRSACLRLSPASVRVNWVQTGFLAMPETHAFASRRVLDTPVPIGRWSTPADFAKLASFLTLRAGYMTGQGVILDGGLTAGNAGT